MSETRWAIRVSSANGKFQCWFDGSTAEFDKATDGDGQIRSRSLWTTREAGWIALWTYRAKGYKNETTSLRRITRKPRLSPEVKAARDALCAAARRYELLMIVPSEVDRLLSAALAFAIAERK
jgi:hypothetical protein